MTKNFSENFIGIQTRFRFAGWLAAAALLTMVAGCETGQFTPVNLTKPAAAETIVLQAGDVLKVSFPGSVNLDTTATIRRDGKITLPLVGEVTAAGMTPADLQKQLSDLYAPQLVSKEVTVEVVSSTFTVYATGAVLHPGKIISNHPMTALEAIMEAGGFDPVKADLKHVKIIRQENGGTKNYILNLKRVIDGESAEPFYLKPEDIIYIPEKFSWF